MGDEGLTDKSDNDVFIYSTPSCLAGSTTSNGQTTCKSEALPGGCPRSLVGILKCLMLAFCQGYTTLSEI